MYVQSYSWYRLETYMYRLHHWTIGKSLKIYKKGGTMGVVLANIQEVHIAIVTSRDTQLSQYPSKWHSENAGTCTCSIEVDNVATYHFLAWSWVCRAAPLQEQGRPESFHCQCEQHPSNPWKLQYTHHNRVGNFRGVLFSRFSWIINYITVKLKPTK